MSISATAGAPLTHVERAPNPTLERGIIAPRPTGSAMAPTYADTTDGHTGRGGTPARRMIAMPMEVEGRRVWDVYTREGERHLNAVAPPAPPSRSTLCLEIG